MPLLRSRCSVASRTRGLLVFSEADEHLTETLLARASGAALAALSTHVDQFCDPLPAGSARDGVLAAVEELLGVLSRLADCLLFLGVVVVVEVVNVFLGLLDGLCALLGELLCPLGVLGISLCPPLLDDVWLLLLFGICSKTGVVADGRSGYALGCALLER